MHGWMDVMLAGSEGGALSLLVTRPFEVIHQLDEAKILLVVSLRF